MNRERSACARDGAAVPCDEPRKFRKQRRARGLVLVDDGDEDEPAVFDDLPDAAAEPETDADEAREADAEAALQEQLARDEAEDLADD